jgi:hypothetical protein
MGIKILTQQRPLDELNIRFNQNIFLQFGEYNKRNEGQIWLYFIFLRCLPYKGRRNI